MSASGWGRRVKIALLPLAMTFGMGLLQGTESVWERNALSERGQNGVPHALADLPIGQEVWQRVGSASSGHGERRAAVLRPRERREDGRASRLLAIRSGESLLASAGTRNVEGQRVSLSICPGAEVGAYAVEEQVSRGLAVVSVNEGGEWDSSAGVIKWGPWFDAADRELRYEVSGPEGVYAVSGLGSFDGVSVETEGDRVIDFIGGTRDVRVRLMFDGTLPRLFIESEILPTSFIVEASIDLENWVEIARGTENSRRLELSPIEGEQSHRFFRVRY